MIGTGSLKKSLTYEKCSGTVCPCEWHMFGGTAGSRHLDPFSGGSNSKSIRPCPRTCAKLSSPQRQGEMGRQCVGARNLAFVSSSAHLASCLERRFNSINVKRNSSNSYHKVAFGIDG